MNLHRLHPCFAFIHTLADFIIENFNLTSNNLKVILPSGTACSYLQKVLVEKQKVTFLPTTVSFYDILAEDGEIFKIPSEDVERVNHLEQKIILAEIIQSFDKLNLNIVQALKFVTPLTNLFQEFICNNIPIDTIKNLSIVNHAEHWYFIYEFLNYAYENWQKKLFKFKKADRSIYQIKMLIAEVERLKNDENNFVIVAGIFGHDKSSWNFIKNIADSSRGFVILPPIPNFDNNIIQHYTNGSDPLYCLNQLLKYLNKNLSDFKPLKVEEEQVTQLDGLITSNEETIEANLSSNIIIEYHEFEDIFVEAEMISLLCKKHKDQTIAIIVNNEKSKEFYSNFLFKNIVKFQDCLGHNLSKMNISLLIINISELLYSEFSLTKLFILLKNPIVNCNHVMTLEQLLSNKNRFVSTILEITELVKKTEDITFINWWQALSEIFKEKNIENNNFNDMLRKSINAAETVCPTIWLSNYGSETAQLFSELIKFKVNLTLKNTQDFSLILKNLIAGARVYNNKLETNIIICKPEDAMLLKFDLIILADFSDGNWPASQYISPWLNKQMQDELKFYSNQIKLSSSLYYFYLLVHNPRVIITRSIKQMSNISLLPSPYIMKLRHIAPNAVKILNCQEFKKSLATFKLTHSFGIVNEGVISSFVFPTQLSVTDIEMLIRSPYSFYAKKILGLRKYENIATSPKLSEFGSFIHSVIGHYTQDYDQLANDKITNIIHLSNKLLQEMLLPLHVKEKWKIKFGAIAKEFIKFDEERRSNDIDIYCETKGVMKLKVLNTEIKITAIADRIEINKYGLATILDYKTGTLPLKKDVLSGFSPQLILEALILLEGGFNIKAKKIEKLIYVKIASSKPYIQTVKIEINKEELNEHLKGLQNLLEHYISTKTFPTGIDFLKYNDYTHLSRKM